MKPSNEEGRYPAVERSQENEKEYEMARGAVMLSMKDMRMKTESLSSLMMQLGQNGHRRNLPTKL
jgi:hypothetical protein